MSEWHPGDTAGTLFDSKVFVTVEVVCERLKSLAS